ncbi:IS110 family transposase [Brucella sp. 2280]|uniref:IS110 family transposase n=1 Tax=Brucella sp. 2280 TaxID=2592625 RepID=UPI001295792B|nr:IS110 family transposase [Brucella sp. 2280]QGA56549.1 IS110 family transposase [Brucella sp. 2280]
MRYFAGIDVAKTVHWICVIDANAEVLLDRAVTNAQEDMDRLVGELRPFAPDLTICLDVMGSIATFVEAALIEAGFRVVHVPGIAVNRARDGFANREAKSDPKDARVIADYARTRPTLRPVEHDDETTIAIRLMIGRRRNLVEEQTRRIARLRRYLGSIHPELEIALDINGLGSAHLLTRYVTPTEIRRAGPKRILAHLQRLPHLHKREEMAHKVFEVAQRQHTIVPGEATFASLVRELAEEIILTREKLARLDKGLETLLARHPDAALIRTLPGMGAILTASFIAAAGSIARFKSAGAIAATAGLAPVMRQSGYSRVFRRTYGGDKDLKRVFFQSAFCAYAKGDPVCRAFYNRKRREGKRHTQAIIALARRRVNVLWTMLKSRQPCDPERAITS